MFIGPHSHHCSDLSFPRRFAAIAALATAIALTTSSALAQPGKKKDKEELKPPTPQQVEYPSNWWGTAAMLFGIAFVLTASLISSKRGHQD